MDHNRLIVHLYHCKYSGEANAGCRVDDFYAVCGQAKKKNEAICFDRGNTQVLDEIARRMDVLRPEFTIFIVQPGLSKAKLSQSSDDTKPILDLRASTGLYLNETDNISFSVIGNT